MTALRTMLAGMVVMAFMYGADVLGQTRQNPNPPPSTGSRMGTGISPLDRSDTNTVDPLSARMEEQQIRSRNSDRQKRLVSDTDKLVELTRQLKEQVEQQSEPPRPADLGKKAEEIEKLAKSVKDRMKG
ncbi:hypothetical protein [Edaphobacter bradus]|uniref:hypothetical protein n=1 Tax=Edaphobacter bradus TaxID=2259016 RepID=UPI0021E0142B|nr:hypothetical protein [Edaphobacter bradus]